MALALYRKYRPRTFAEVIGQEHVTEPLAQALRTGRLHHAYLFSGPRGCGKTSSARILARSLNCEKGPTPDPCGTCESCRSLASDGAGSIDVIEIDAASHGGVDDARELRERAIFAPVSSRFKVYVIDEAHMVSSAGFNALLKLVEEPPEYVKFVFATTEPEKVLGTIKSRTHHYPFRLIPPATLRPFLEDLCQREGVAVEPAVFPLVVRAGAGSARDTLSVLDQLIAGAGPDGVTYARATALLGVTDGALIDEMCDALGAGDGAAVFGAINRVSDAGHDPRRFAADLLDRLRDLIILRQVPEAATKGLLDVPADVLERMTTQAERLGPASLSRMADLVHNGLVEMRGTTAPRLLLELICARMLLPGADDSTAALLHRIERMERRFELGGVPAAGATAPVTAAAPAAAPPAASVPPAAPGAGSAPAVAAGAPAGQPGRAGQPTRAAQPPSAAARPAPAVAPAPPAGGGSVPAPTAAVPQPQASHDAPASPGAAAAGGVLDAAAVRRVWDEVLVMVGRQSKRAAAMVREATVRDVQGETLILLFKHAFYAEALSRQPDLLISALYELFGGRWQVRCDLAGPDNVAQGTPVGGSPALQARQSAAPRAPQRQEPPRPAGPGGPAGPGSGGTGAGGPGAGGAYGRRGAPAAGPVAQNEWPTTAVPGGAAPAGAADPAPQGSVATRPVSPAPQQPAAQAQAPARPAQAVEAPARPAQAAQAPARSAQAVQAPARPVPAAQAPAGAGPAEALTPQAQARAAAARQGQRPGAGRPGAGQRQAAGRPTRPGGRPGASAGGGVWDGPQEEPPYDPEYDGPVYPGFDPGDAPLDDDEGGVPRESSEEQAVRLLAETLGAERLPD